MDYYTVLQKIHHKLAPSTYLEVGVRNGESLALASAHTRAYGIVPQPHITATLPASSHIYACTSDEFFERFEVSQELHLPIDMAFIDGSHLFEDVLRDFINIELLCADTSIIILHDTYPENSIMAARERTTNKWCGDVFKMLLILKKYRHDLEILHLDVSPSGLSIVKNLNKSSRVLQDNYVDIVSEYSALTFESIERNARRELCAVSCSNSLLDEFIGNIPPPSDKEKQTAEKIQTAAQFLFAKRHRQPEKIKMLGVLLCYNDADVLGENIEYLLQQNHDIVVWDHGSTDETGAVLDTYDAHFIERKFIPREVDFYVLYQLMSRNLLKNYIKEYAVISWPDQDEFLEGPFRDRPYYEYLLDFYYSPYSWIRFNNMNFWWSRDDDVRLKTTERVKFYSHFPDCSPRIRAWRADVTNNDFLIIIRWQKVSSALSALIFATILVAATRTCCAGSLLIGTILKETG